MSLDWDSLSEIVYGAVLKGKLSINSVRPEMFAAPYNDGIRMAGQGHTEPEYHIAKIGLTPVQSALDAYNAVSGTKADWVHMLEHSAMQSILADEFERSAKRLRRGEDVELSKVIETYNLLDKSTSRLTPMDQIVAQDVTYQKIGWDAIDTHLNGIPMSGLIVTGGAPGAGKTTYLAKKLARFVKTYPDKVAIMFTLEMIASEYVKRALQVEKLTTEEKSRILICDEIMPVEELCNVASRTDNVGYIGLDFVDLLITDDTSESEMAKIYRHMQKLAKRLKIPVEVLSQLSRSYVGGIPRPTNLRWTSLAEALAWEILMLYNPNTDFRASGESGNLQSVDGKAYIIAWKLRGGLSHHCIPGAIQMDWDGATGWGNSGRWFSINSG